LKSALLKHSFLPAAVSACGHSAAAASELQLFQLALRKDAPVSARQFA